MIPKSTMPLVAVLGLCLGACTDEPSESDMRLAASNMLTRLFSAQTFLVGSPRGGQAQAPSVSTFHKLGCEAALPNLGGYNCRFEAGINGGPAIPGKGRFFKAADGTLAMVE